MEALRSCIHRNLPSFHLQLPFLRRLISNGYLLGSLTNSSTKLTTRNTSIIDNPQSHRPNFLHCFYQDQSIVEQRNPFILELFDQNFDNIKVVMFSHHFFSCSKIQESNMVMTTKDVMMSNLTCEERTIFKISASSPRGGNATRSPMTTLPSLNKGRGTKDHAISTLYGTNQETIGK